MRALTYRNVALHIMPRVVVAGAKHRYPNDVLEKDRRQ